MEIDLLEAAAGQSMHTVVEANLLEGATGQTAVVEALEAAAGATALVKVDLLEAAAG